MEEDYGANSCFVNWNGQPLLVIWPESENDDDSDKKTKKRRSKRFRLQQKLKAATEELERTRQLLEESRARVLELELDKRDDEWDLFVERYRRADGQIDCFPQRR